MRDLFLVGLAALQVAVASVAQQPAVSTSLGTIYGTTTAVGTYEFLGIPYAKATRFAPPASLVNDTFPGKQFQATAFGRCCLQTDTPTYIPAQDEECLSLNIFTPAALNHAPLPVMVWIHGGGAQFGCSAQSLPILYNGSNIIANAPSTTPVIVVSINYRLGVLANLYLEAAAAESSWPTSANYQILDIQAALQWLHAHIKDFGGDPNRITTFGESAGGNLGITLGAAKGSPGLYVGHISESGTGANFAAWYNKSTAIAQGRRFIDASPCAPSKIHAQSYADPAVLQCMRGVPAWTLVELGANLTDVDVTMSVVDGLLFPEYEYTAMVNRHYANVSLLIGNNDPDAFAACASYPTAGPSLAVPYAQKTLQQWGLWPQYVQQIIDLYNVSSCSPTVGAPNQCCRVVELMMMDYMMVCNARRIMSATWQDAGSDALKFWYNFECTPQCPSSPPGICQHTSEIEYVFGTLSNYESSSEPVTCTWPASVRTFSNRVIAAWTSFAWFGTPAHALPSWQPFTPSDAQPFVYTLSENAPFSGAGFPRSAQCDVWDQIERDVDAALFGSR